MAATDFEVVAVMASGEEQSISNLTAETSLPDLVANIGRAFNVPAQEIRLFIIGGTPLEETSAGSTLGALGIACGTRLSILRVENNVISDDDRDDRRPLCCGGVLSRCADCESWDCPCASCECNGFYECTCGSCNYKTNVRLDGATARDPGLLEQILQTS